MVKKVVEKVKKDQENIARRALIEDLFADFNRSRTEVYKMNFFRGIFFGFGSVLGATLVVAMIAYLLAILAQHIPPLHDFFQAISQAIQPRQQ